MIWSILRDALAGGNTYLKENPMIPLKFRNLLKAERKSSVCWEKNNQDKTRRGLVNKACLESVWSVSGFVSCWIWPRRLCFILSSTLVTYNMHNLPKLYNLHLLLGECILFVLESEALLEFGYYVQCLLLFLGRLQCLAYLEKIEFKTKLGMFIHL